MYFSMPSMHRSRHPLVRALSLLLGVAEEVAAIDLLAVVVDMA